MLCTFSKARIAEILYVFFGFLSVVILYGGIFYYDDSRMVVSVALIVLFTAFIAAADIPKHFPLWLAVPMVFLIHGIIAFLVVDCARLHFGALAILLFMFSVAGTMRLSWYTKTRGLKSI